MINVEGVIPAMVTPFGKNGEVDEQGLRYVIDFLVEKRVHGILAVGTVGEFHSMRREERKRIFEISVDQSNGRVPIYAGTASVSTDETVAISRDAEDVGVDVLTVLTPYFVKISEEELFQHYRRVAQSANLPIMLYNNPGRTGVLMSPECLSRCRDLDNVVAMKDSSGDISLFQEYLRVAGEKVAMVVGKDGLILSALILGARGTVNAIGNIVPDWVVKLYQAVKKKDYAVAIELQKRISTLRQALHTGSYPVAVKEAMNVVGLPGGYPRRPLLPLTDAQKNDLNDTLTELDILKK